MARPRLSRDGGSSVGAVSSRKGINRGLTLAGYGSGGRGCRGGMHRLHDSGAGGQQDR